MTGRSVSQVMKRKEEREGWEGGKTGGKEDRRTTGDRRKRREVEGERRVNGRDKERQVPVHGSVDG